MWVNKTCSPSIEPINNLLFDSNSLKWRYRKWLYDSSSFTPPEFQSQMKLTLSDRCFRSNSVCPSCIEHFQTAGLGKDRGCLVFQQSNTLVEINENELPPLKNSTHCHKKCEGADVISWVNSEQKTNPEQDSCGQKFGAASIGIWLLSDPAATSIPRATKRIKKTHVCRMLFCLTVMLPSQDRAALLVLLKEKKFRECWSFFLTFKDLTFGICCLYTSETNVKRQKVLQASDLYSGLSRILCIHSTETQSDVYKQQIH